MNAMSKIALAALAAVALSPFAAHAEKVNLTYLTHWSPESVAMLEKAASAYAKEHPDVAVSIRAVPFGDLLTTLRASGGGSGGATMASIYNAWLPDLAKDKLIAPNPRGDGNGSQGGLAGRRRRRLVHRRGALRLPERNRPLRAQLQQEALRGGRDRRAARQPGTNSSPTPKSSPTSPRASRASA